MYRVRAEGDPSYLASYAGDPVALAAVAGLKKAGGMALKKLKQKRLASVSTVERFKAGPRTKKFLKLAEKFGLPKGTRGAGAERVGGRRMRVTNPKALRRALRRVTGFAKTLKRTKRAVALAASAMGVRKGRGGGRSGHPAGCRCVHCSRR